ncbi:ankyrin repeat domain-containing protein 50-like isoform X2 [Haliotis rubra]|uniref:ankyrin repeat domain-containing protein 50-like isoform X2 n=1 Tax=Haliotis rubra TaxID=36100 RepID=UPI001EE5E3CA|nr:ankyrin repeat domain-containing protein 50-like isoform X2 [Haliotis rubra]
MQCSQNCINNTCNHKGGACTLGCKDGNTGTFCEVTEDGHARKAKESSEPTWATIGSGVAAGVLLLFILMGVWYRCRQKQWLHQGPVKDTPLHKAVIDGNLDTVKQVMSEYEIDVNTRGLYGLTPLMLAAVRGQNDVFEHLHKEGADMTLTDGDGDHILSTACVGGNIDIVKYVVSKQPELINRKRNDGRTSLMWAAWHGRENIFGYLLGNGADHISMDNDRDNILHYACNGGHPGIVEKILAEAEIDIHSIDIYGRTAVMEAADQGHKQVFDILVGKGSSISHVDKDGNNVLHAACRGGHKEMVEYILSQRGFNINRRGKDGATPLMIAARGGHRGVCDLLVGKGADTSLLDNMENNILHMASMEGHESMVKHILSQNFVDINSRGQRGRTPLLWAALRNQNEVIRLLVSQGADLLQVDDGGNNVLHIACKTGNGKIAQYVLLKNELDINAGNHCGETASMIAKRTYQMELYELLMSQ